MPFSERLHDAMNRLGEESPSNILRVTAMPALMTGAAAAGIAGLSAVHKAELLGRALHDPWGKIPRIDGVAWANAPSSMSGLRNVALKATMGAMPVAAAYALYDAALGDGIKNFGADDAVGVGSTLGAGAASAMPMRKRLNEVFPLLSKYTPDGPTVNKRLMDVVKATGLTPENVPTMTAHEFGGRLRSARAAGALSDDAARLAVEGIGGSMAGGSRFESALAKWIARPNGKAPLWNSADNVAAELKTIAGGISSKRLLGRMGLGLALGGLAGGGLYALAKNRN
jgi:hypothetical protein